MMAPIRRVDAPQEVWNGYCRGVVAAREGHVIGAAELVTEVVARAALQGLAVLHHRSMV